MGPSYFQPASSPLIVGSLDESSLTELLRRHRDDPILETIRTFGPARLREELSKIPGFEDFAWKDWYSGICDLCIHINFTPGSGHGAAKSVVQPGAGCGEGVEQDCPARRKTPRRDWTRSFNWRCGSAALDIRGAR
jgi:hypothetical protein